MMIRPHLKYCVQQFWTEHTLRKWRGEQHRSLENKFYKEKRKEQGIFTDGFSATWWHGKDLFSAATEDSKWAQVMGEQISVEYEDKESIQVHWEKFAGIEEAYSHQGLQVQECCSF